jgi:uncharacterized membrane protein
MLEFFIVLVIVLFVLGFLHENATVKRLRITSDLILNRIRDHLNEDITKSETALDYHIVTAKIDTLYGDYSKVSFKTLHNASFTRKNILELYSENIQNLFTEEEKNQLFN